MTVSLLSICTWSWLHEMTIMLNYLCCCFCWKSMKIKRRNAIFNSRHFLFKVAEKVQFSFKTYCKLSLDKTKQKNPKITKNRLGQNFHDGDDMQRTIRQRHRSYGRQQWWTLGPHHQARRQNKDIWNRDTKKSKIMTNRANNISADISMNVQRSEEITSF